MNTKLSITFESLCACTTWNSRYKELQALIHKGPEARTLVVKFLHWLEERKDLSFGERRMLDLAQNYAAYESAQNDKVKSLEIYRKTKEMAKQ